jgi:hypothetical protein
MIVAGDRQHGLNVLVERKSRLTHVSFLENKTTAVDLPPFFGHSEC